MEDTCEITNEGINRLESKAAVLMSKVIRCHYLLNAPICQKQKKVTSAHQLVMPINIWTNESQVYFHLIILLNSQSRLIVEENGISHQCG